MDPTTPKISPISDEPLIPKGNGGSYEVSLPTVNSLPLPEQQSRPSPKDLLPGSVFGTRVWNFGGKDGVYLDAAKGIYAGNSVFAGAPFSVDLDGNLVASSGTFNGTVQTAPSGERIVLDSITNSIKIYNSGGVLTSQISGENIGGIPFSQVDGALNVTNSIRLNGAGLSQANQLWMYDNAGVDKVILEYDSLQLSITQQVVLGNGGISSGHFIPFADNVSTCGNASFRWSLVRGVVITPGDLAWEETHCHTCNKEFKEEDKLTLIVKEMKTVEGETLTHTVPICKECFLND